MSADVSTALVDVFAAALTQAGVERRLTGGHAVVLERIPRGGGSTRWYWVRSTGDLDLLCARLGAGSVVSFYFDDRIKIQPLDDDVEMTILDLVALHGDAVVGVLSQDGLEVLVDFIAGPNELSQFCSEVPAGQPLFFGPFPGRDSDGRGAVTLTLADADGIVREHPH